MSLEVSGHESSNAVVGGEGPRKRKSFDKPVGKQPRARPCYSRAKSMAALTNFRTNAMKNSKDAASARFLQKKQQHNTLDLDFHESNHSRKSSLHSSGSGSRRSGRTGFNSSGDGDRAAAVATVTEMAVKNSALGGDVAEGGEGSTVASNGFEGGFCYTSHDYCSVSEYSTQESSFDSFCDADERSEADKEYMVKQLGASVMSDDVRDVIDEANMDLAATDDEADEPMPGFDDVDDDDVMNDDEYDLALEDTKLSAVNNNNMDTSNTDEPPSVVNVPTAIATVNETEG